MDNVMQEIFIYVYLVSMGSNLYKITANFVPLDALHAKMEIVKHVKMDFSQLKMIITQYVKKNAKEDVTNAQEINVRNVQLDLKMTGKMDVNQILAAIQIVNSVLLEHIGMMIIIVFYAQITVDPVIVQLATLVLGVSMKILDHVHNVHSPAQSVIILNRVQLVLLDFI